jgi:predicted O-linked N-acetylglucosamine transferase (SPINDLY family)
MSHNAPSSNPPPEAVRVAYDCYLRGDLAASLAACQRLLAAFPASADSWNLAGLLAAARGELSSAMRFYRQALALDPAFVEAHSNLGAALSASGRALEALGSFERALELRPADRAAMDNLLLAILCVPEIPAPEIAALHRRWGQALEAQVAPLVLPVNHQPRDRRPLHVGYVSADFKRHAVAWFLEPVLAHHDPGRVKVHAYVNLPGAGDEVTARMRRHCAVFRSLVGLADADAARMIAADGIDVLVDLGGHTAGHRLGIFAHRPAPVQVTYLGYPATTGLSRIQYRLTDAVADPPGATEALHTEQLVRLPAGFLCYGPPAEAPLADPGPPPSLKAGQVTFASFNDASKLSEKVLGVWARVLLAVPGSRLRLKNRGLGDPGTRQRMLDLLRASGVEADRLELIAFKPDLASHLACYADVDIALDTFPYNGTTTTCEALWMGVPVITLSGKAHVGRVGTSLLQGIGLPELCADNEASYVAAAATLAADGPRLRGLRAGLRDRLRGAPLLDAPGFVRTLEQTYRELCARRPEAG